jgi:hypothetical protein
MSAFQTVATEFYKAFTRDNPRKVWTLVDSAPEWMRAAMHDAHFDGRLADDWIYEHARMIVDALSERESVDVDEQHAICDGLVDIYTSALCSWLGDNARNAALVDEAQSEGLVAPDATLEQRLQSAQYMALTYIVGALVSAIEAQAEARDLDDDSETTVQDVPS